MAGLTDLISGIFNTIGDQAVKLRTAITGHDPASDAALAQAALDLEKLQTQGTQAIAAAQTQVNVAEANVTGSPAFRLFVAGWRPFIGWICGFAFTIQYVIQPVGVWAGAHWQVIDMSVPTQVVLGMLGLGTGVARTVEKIAGASGNH